MLQLMGSKRVGHNLVTERQEREVKHTLEFTAQLKYSLLGIYQREMKASIHANNCTCMFIATLFVITKDRHKSKCPSIREQINCGAFIQ